MHSNHYMLTLILHSNLYSTNYHVSNEGKLDTSVIWISHTEVTLFHSVMLKSHLCGWIHWKYVYPDVWLSKWFPLIPCTLYLRDVPDHLNMADELKQALLCDIKTPLTIFWHRSGGDKSGRGGDKSDNSLQEGTFFVGICHFFLH